ncbi:MAG: RNA 2',3'-cyclic phosphodiesterase [Actinobacteria bacterium]|nr:RNA 2',3'-cyclic phosphodiesterase [Actinomycetota bacterium]
MPRLFVAVPLPATVVDLLSSLPRPAEKGVRWTKPQHWHVTLRFLGDCSVEDAAATLAPLPASTATVRLGPAISRLGRNIVCISAEGLDELAAAVDGATAAIGEPPDPRPFRGHVTLARLRHRAACGVAGTPFSATFAADRVELVESVLAADGPRHVTRLVVPLSGSSF